MEKITRLYNNLSLEHAVSHRIHTRLFEVLGYLSLIDRERLFREDEACLRRAEDLCKTLITEVHELIDYYNQEI